MLDFLGRDDAILSECWPVCFTFSTGFLILLFSWWVSNHSSKMQHFWR